MPTTVSYDGVRIFYQSYGTNNANESHLPVLFMTHGFGSGSKLWDAQVPVLLRHGYRVITWDMRGHANSECPSANSEQAPNTYSKWSQIHDMKAVLAACDVLPLHATTGKQPFFMIAHSMGGMDQLLFTMKWPKAASGLLLYGTGPGFKGDRGRLGWNKQAAKIAHSYGTKGLDALIGSDRTKGHTSSAGLIAACLGNYTQREDDPLALEFAAMGGQLALARNLNTIEQPTAVMIGQYDKTFGRASDMMAKDMPNATLYKVMNGGHMACEKTPKEFNQLMFVALAELQKSLSISARL